MLERSLRAIVGTQGVARHCKFIRLPEPSQHETTTLFVERTVHIVLPTKCIQTFASGSGPGKFLLEMSLKRTESVFCLQIRHSLTLSFPTQIPLLSPHFVAAIGVAPEIFEWTHWRWEWRALRCPGRRCTVGCCTHHQPRSPTPERKILS